MIVVSTIVNPYSGERTTISPTPVKEADRAYTGYQLVTNKPSVTAEKHNSRIPSRREAEEVEARLGFAAPKAHSEMKKKASSKEDMLCMCVSHNAWMNS